MDAKIKKYLESEKIKFQLVAHRKVYTAFNSAETQHVKTNEVTKTVLAKLSNGDFILVCVPAGKRVDLKKIAKSINDQALKNYKLLVKKDPKTKRPKTITAKLASEKNILSVLKTKVGLISPFSQVYGLTLLFDNKLAKNKNILISAGSYTESLKLTTTDFLKRMVGIKGNFTQ